MSRACTQLRQPDVGAHEVEQGEEVACQCVIACDHTAKLLEPTKEALHQIAVLIQMAIIVSWVGTVTARRYPHLHAHGLDVGHQRIRIVALAADDGLDVQALTQGLGLRHVRHFAVRQEPAQRDAPRIDREMGLGTPPAPRAPACVRDVFFGAPAACWWARTTVRSMSSASKSASWRIAAMIRCHTSCFPHREQRVYVACQLPNAGAKSRHRRPVRAIHNPASIHRRWSFAVTPQSVDWFLLSKIQTVPTSINCVQPLVNVRRLARFSYTSRSFCVSVVTTKARG